MCLPDILAGVYSAFFTNPNLVNLTYNLSEIVQPLSCDFLINDRMQHFIILNSEKEFKEIIKSILNKSIKGTTKKQKYVFCF